MPTLSMSALGGKADSPNPLLSLCRVDEHHLGVLERLYLEHCLVRDRGTVASFDAHAVHVDAADRRHEVSVAVGRKPILNAVAGLERGAEHPGLGADGERIIITGKAARQRHEAARPV